MISMQPSPQMFVVVGPLHPMTFKRATIQAYFEGFQQCCFTSSVFPAKNNNGLALFNRFCWLQVE
jgi:hypothetical protein